MGLSLKKIIRAIGEPFEGIAKLAGHSAREVGKFIGKNPMAIPLLTMIYPPAGAFLSSLPVIGDVYKTLFPFTAGNAANAALTQPSSKFNLQQFLPLLLLSSGSNPQKALIALTLPQMMDKVDLSTPQGVFTTMLMLSALSDSGSKPIVPQVFSPITPEQRELLQKAISYIAPPTMTINPNIAPTTHNPFAPFVGI